MKGEEGSRGKEVSRSSGVGFKSLEMGRNSIPPAFDSPHASH